MHFFRMQRSNESVDRNMDLHESSNSILFFTYVNVDIDKSL